MEGSLELNQNLGKQLTRGDTKTNSEEAEKPKHNQPPSPAEACQDRTGDSKNRGQKKIHMGQGPIKATFDRRTIGPGGGVGGSIQQFQSWNLGIESKGLT